MYKQQIFIIVMALALIAGMYSLPKVLVRDKEKVLAADASAASTDAMANSTHTNNLDAAQVTAVDDLRKAYINSADKEKKTKFADSLAVLFKGASMFDSAAHYRDAIASLNPGVENWIKAGDGYFDAFSFATDAQKANQLGEKARAFYQKVLEKDPGQLDVKANLAMTYVASSNPMQGIVLLREILQKEPAHERASFNMGLLSMQSGQYEKAIERFEQVLKMHPDNSQAKFYLGISYAETGHSAEAKDLLKEIKKTNNDPAVQATVDEYLKKLK
jgi:tetratricopeptide (TPR) repeat protein